ncbi:MAG: methionine adenosyltransferase [Clostridiales bacterium]|nr:MAG: methionine adenosyltransferase [Clostridiales bacterium]
MNRYIFTSESVTEGHPDKMCDQISDSILDDILDKDPDARVACETLATTGLIIVSGEISTECYVDIQKVARKKIAEIGYTRAKFGFDASTCAVLVSLHDQSPDIAMGVDSSSDESDIGAGDQGIIFGYACDETPEYMPAPIVYAHKLTRRLSEVRKEGILDFLRPDGKSQVSVEYDENGNILRIDAVVVSAQHDPNIDIEIIRKEIKEKVIEAVLPNELIDDNTKFFINPTGQFVIGGPQGDTGLTGRKIIVDTYGGVGRHGGGAFSGKDPTKVDRSGAYAARYAAKNLVAAGVAKKLEIQIGYAIGVSKPVSININTFNTGTISDEKIIDIVEKVFDFRPSKIIKNLDLCKPIYSQVAAYGHFGRNDLSLSWEKLNKVEEIKKLVWELE